MANRRAKRSEIWDPGYVPVEHIWDALDLVVCNDILGSFLRLA